MVVIVHFQNIDNCTSPHESDAYSCEMLRAHTAMQDVGSKSAWVGGGADGFWKNSTAIGEAHSRGGTGTGGNPSKVFECNQQVFCESLWVTFCAGLNVEGTYENGRAFCLSDVFWYQVLWVPNVIHVIIQMHIRMRFLSKTTGSFCRERNSA